MVKIEYPAGSNRSRMIVAVSSACASVMVVAKLFQLFQPIGGVCASRVLARGAAPAPTDPATTGVMAAPAIRVRRVMSSGTSVAPGIGDGGHRGARSVKLSTSR